MPRAVRVSLLIFLCLCGCASSTWLSSSPVIDRVRQRGELRVGMAGDYPPLNMLDRSGQNIGLEPDLARFLAKSLGVELVVVNRPFSELIATLEAGEVDAVLSGMTMTPERNQRVAFAGPYFISGKAVLTRSSALASAENARDLDRSRLRLAALEGTTSETFIKDAMPSASLVIVGDYARAVRMVIDGKVDAMIADYPVCVVQRALHRDHGLQTISAPLSFEPIGIALPRHDLLFVNLVQNYLTSLEGTGLLDRLRVQWFKDASWVRRLP